MQSSPSRLISQSARFVNNYAPIQDTSTRHYKHFQSTFVSVAFLLQSLHVKTFADDVFDKIGLVILTGKYTAVNEEALENNLCMTGLIDHETCGNRKLRKK